MTNTKSFCLGLAIGSASSLIGSLLYLSSLNLNNISSPDKFYQGHAANSRLEIECEHHTNNNGPAIYMTIGNKSYILNEVDKRPEISDFKIKPVEIIIRE